MMQETREIIFEWLQFSSLYTEADDQSVNDSDNNNDNDCCLLRDKIFRLET